MVGCHGNLKTRRLYVTCSQDKWDKARRIIFSLLEQVKDDPNAGLDRKQLMKDRGFLVHIARTFTQLVPYLKGIHHSLESWRLGRNPDGWKLDTSDMMEWLVDELDLEDAEELSEGGVKVTKSNWKQLFDEYRERCEGEAPDRVMPVKRLRRDLEAMAKILAPEEPIHRLIRGEGIKKFLLSFGDASGEGFGSSWEAGDGTIHFRFGIWGDEMNDSSSNLRELKNLVDTLQKMHEEGLLQGVEIFLFTDNSVAESAFFKGSSKSEKLHELILALRLLESQAGVRFHFIHVAGTRMIEQGSDGLSRGNLTEGVMGGKSMSSFVPLHLNAIDRSPAVKTWVEEWMNIPGDDTATFLEPKDWFLRAHNIIGWRKNIDGILVPQYKKGVFVWTPPPAVSDAALEELRKSRQKHMDSTHLFICPRLMTPHWRRHLHRVVDVLFEIPAGTLAVATSTSHTGSGRAFAKVVQERRRVRGISSAETSAQSEGIGQYATGVGVLAVTKQRGTYPSILQNPKTKTGGSWIKQDTDAERYLCGRKGDILSSPFQCDRCWFINLKRIEPSKSSFSDTRLLKYIRRANLDMMWSKEPSTVKSILDGTLKNFHRAADLGLQPMSTPRGPWPVIDNQGMQIALQILRQSQERGRHDETYQQFDSIRRLRSAAFNEYESSVVGNLRGNTFTGDRGKALRTSDCPTLSLFFEKFMKGLEKRMGRLVKRDKALDVRILIELLRNYSSELEDVRTNSSRKRFVTVVMAYMCVSFSGGLRGGEGFLLEASSLCELIDEGKEHWEIPHVLAPLLGRFKNEVGECKMLFALASVTTSGIQNRQCLERLVRVLVSEGKHRQLGPAICDTNGQCITRARMNAEFHRALERVQHEKPELIAADLSVKEIYNIHRSFRRGATSRATAAGVKESDINFNNRWGNAQRIRGRNIKFKMSVVRFQSSSFRADTRTERVEDLMLKWGSYSWELKLQLDG